MKHFILHIVAGLLISVNICFGMDTILELENFQEVEQLSDNSSTDNSDSSDSEYNSIQFDSSNQLIQHIIEVTQDQQEMQKICAILFLRELMIGSFVGDQFASKIGSDDSAWSTAFNKHEKLHNALWENLSDQSRMNLRKLENLLKDEESGFTYDFFCLMMKGFRELASLYINEQEARIELSKRVRATLICARIFSNNQKWKHVHNLITEAYLLENIQILESNLKPFNGDNSAFVSTLFLGEKLRLQGPLIDLKNNEFFVRTFLLSVCEFNQKTVDKLLNEETDLSKLPDIDSQIKNCAEILVKSFVTAKKASQLLEYTNKQLQRKLSNQASIELCQNAIHFKRKYASLYEGLLSALPNTECFLLKNVEHFESQLPTTIFFLDRFIVDETDINLIEAVLAIFKFYNEINKIMQSNGTYNYIPLDILKNGRLKTETVNYFRNCLLLKEEHPMLYNYFCELIVIHNLKIGDMNSGSFAISADRILTLENRIKFNQFDKIQIPNAGMGCFVNDCIERLNSRKQFLIEELRKQQKVKNSVKKKNLKSKKRKTSRYPINKTALEEVIPNDQKDNVLEFDLQMDIETNDNAENIEPESSSFMPKFEKEKSSQKRNLVSQAEDILHSLFASLDLKHEDKQHAVINHLLCHRTMKVIVYFAQKELKLNTEKLNVVLEFQKNDMRHVISPLINKYLKFGYALQVNSFENAGIHQELTKPIYLNKNQWALVLEARIIMDAGYDIKNALKDQNKDIRGCHRGAYVFIFNNDTNKCTHAMFHEAKTSKKINAY